MIIILIHYIAKTELWIWELRNNNWINKQTNTNKWWIEYKEETIRLNTNKQINLIQTIKRFKIQILYLQMKNFKTEIRSQF